MKLKRKENFEKIDDIVDRFDNELREKDYSLYQLLGMQIILSNNIVAKSFKIQRTIKRGKNETK